MHEIILLIRQIQRRMGIFHGANFSNHHRYRPESPMCSSFLIPRHRNIPCSTLQQKHILNYKISIYRPKFLQYKYLYDYQHNYYNDVIDYLDRKSRGLNSEIPRPQTWAERALRTYVSKIDQVEKYRRELEEKLKKATKIEKKTRHSTFMSYHSKEYMSRRVSSTLWYIEVEGWKKIVWIQFHRRGEKYIAYFMYQLETKTWCSIELSLLSQ